MQPLGLRFFGLALFALFVFLAVSVLSYSTADAPDRIVFPPSGDVRNFCGPVGAYAASLLFNGLGLATFFLFIPLGIEAVELLRAKKLNQIFLRSLGLGFVLVGISGLCGLFGTSLAFLPGPVIGPGGYLGTAVAVLLSRYVAVTGSCIFLFSLLVAGLILLGDQTLLRILALLLPAHAEREDISPKTKSLADSFLPCVAETVHEKCFEPQIELPIEPRIELQSESEFEESAPQIFRGWFGSRPKTVRLVEPQADPIVSQDEAANGDEFEVEETPQRIYELPPLELLTPPEPFDDAEYEETIKRQSQQLEKAFANFNVQVQVVDIQTGPVISQFELELSKGLRVKTVQSLENDLAVALKLSNVRIVSPIPGKNTVGVELPNEKPQVVRLRDVMELRPEAEEKMNIPIYFGKDVSGQPMIADLTKLPHLLIAGRTGTGKSVCLNSIIVSVLMTRTPEQVRMLMIDPKMVELSPYGSIPHLMHPVVTDMRKAEAILGWAVEKMEERYQLLAAAGVRQLGEYNKLSEADRRRRMKMLDVPDEDWAAIPQSMPYLLIVADEMADLMMTAAKEVETHIIRLAQKSRAVGIHLVLATQKPTVDVVTGLIKSNLPARIAFGVASQTDSRVVLDKSGAERLLGNGDMLFLQPGTSQILRGQGTYVDDKEIESIIEMIGTDAQDFVEELVALNPDEDDETGGGGIGGAGGGGGGNGKYSEEDMKIQRDDLYYQAVEVVIQEGRGSLSLLQRRFRIGYGRASRMIDFMEEDGVVGSHNGSKSREVITTLGAWRRKRAKDNAANSAEQKPVAARQNIAIKPAVKPTLRNNPNEPRRKPKYIEPVFEKPEEEYWEEDEYLDDEESAEDEYEFEEEEEYDEDESDDYVPAPSPRRPLTGGVRLRRG